MTSIKFCFSGTHVYSLQETYVKETRYGSTTFLDNEMPLPLNIILKTF